jgi:hypothetical protein
MKVRYTCRYCSKTNEITSFWKWFWTPHLGAKKLLECKHCKLISYMYRRDGRKWLDWPTEKN